MYIHIFTFPPPKTCLGTPSIPSHAVQAEGDLVVLGRIGGMEVWRHAYRRKADPFGDRAKPKGWVW